MKKVNFVSIYMALALAGAFSFSAFAQKKSKSEEVKPKVQEASKEEEAKPEEPKTPKTYNTTPGILGMGQPHSHSLGFGLGQTFLNGRFKEYGDDKIAFPDIYYSYSASYSFDFLLNFHASKHEKTGKDVRIMGLVPSIKGKLYQFDAFSPYVVGGLGFYWPKWQSTQIESDRKTVFGYTLGAGCDLKLNELFNVGVLVQYHDPFDVKQTNQEEVTGSYYKLMITGMYTFQ